MSHRSILISYRSIVGRASLSLHPAITQSGELGCQQDSEALEWAAFERNGGNNRSEGSTNRRVGTARQRVATPRED